MLEQYIAESMSDEVESLADEIVCKQNCYNTPICVSYGEVSFACFSGSNPASRCSLGERMQIRILNDMNPNAVYRPPKNKLEDLELFISGVKV